MATWTNYGKDPFYLPYKQLLLHALDNIRRGTKVPLLCTPTNYPGYLNATVLIDRLKQYQQSSTTPSSIDFQIALSRWYSTDAIADKLYADKTLRGEWRNIMLFLFEENAEPVSPFENKTLWMCASLAKTTKTTYSAFKDFTWYKNNFSKYTGQRKWKPEIEHYTVPTYDYIKKGMVETSSTRKVLKVEKPEAVVKEDGMISKIISKVFSKKYIENDPLLFDYFKITASWLGNEYSADMKRLFMLAPNNPEPVLAVIVARCLRNPTFWEESSKKMVVSALQVMHEIWHAPGEMAHLFIAASMVASGKTVGNIAGEILD